MARGKQKASPATGPAWESEIIVAWEEDKFHHGGGFFVILDSLGDATDGQSVATYQLDKLGTAKRTTELV